MRTFTVLVIFLTVFTFTLTTAKNTDLYANPSNNEVNVVKYRTSRAEVLPDAARDAIVDAMDNWPSILPKSNIFFLIDLRWEGTWAIATMTSANLEQPLAEGQESHLNLGNMFPLLLVDSATGWQATFGNDSKINELLEAVPNSELDQSAREALFPALQMNSSPSNILQQEYNNYKFPWRALEEWRVTQGWHDLFTGYGFPANHSLDFDVGGPTCNPCPSNSDVMAMAAGTVTSICPAEDNNNDYPNDLLVIRTEGTDELIGYLHLDTEGVRVFEVGNYVFQGQKLGRMIESPPTGLTTTCGQSFGTHLHVYFPEKPFTVDGVKFSEGDVHGGDSLASHQSSFIDVPSTHWAWPYIETLYQNGYVAGCVTAPGPPQFCPNDYLTRAEMAVFVLRGVHGGNWIPEEPGPGEIEFVDTPTGVWYTKWADAMLEEGFTAGCNNAPLSYCPLQVHTRAEASVFFLRILHGQNYVPPAPTCNRFEDVPCGEWYARWMEAAYDAGLIGACGGAGKIKLCPLNPITRAGAAYALVQAKDDLEVPEGTPSLLSSPIDSNIISANNYLQSLSSIPAIDYATYLGGGEQDASNGVTVDSNGNIYMVGYTESDNFPTFDAHQNTYGGESDVFIAKFSSTDYMPVYITYLGGSKHDQGIDITVDINGNVTILGTTDSPDFPTLNPLQPNHAGERDLFIARLNSSGDLLFSTYFGGSDTDIGYGLTTDENGNVYIAGRTYSSDFPTSIGSWQSSKSDGFDAFVLKINTNGTLNYSTFLGGSGFESAYDIAVNSNNEAFVIGDTGSTDFPGIGTVVQNTISGGSDVFLVKLDSLGFVVFSSYLGGTGGDFGRSITLQDTNLAYLTGFTASADFPTVAPLQENHGGGSYDMFISKIDSGNGQLLYSTYLGSVGSEESDDIVLDNDSSIFVAGHTSSATFSPGLRDVFISKITPDGSSLLSIYDVGGTAGDHGHSIVLDETGKIFVAGYTLSANFPTENSYQASLAGYRDAFLLVLGKHEIFVPLVIK